ncbi:MULTISPECIES: TIR domain-containing protein [unclassified Pseudofrankia]|uniref:nucleotide-binding protein n=1 Tax=unclassified Pseudofrankia TaxID=2994372 RepID=UPI0008D9A290|nr:MULTISPECIES: TIR domain-containing protein [unclassified Pseudofrankia]MDT3443544.1 AAA family ATPase [Pseudofrankia sp. BMG5.37]OHV42743.1 hypothetical protein BCD48_30355 [Pseudofrankia sp. BMG5.36]
MTTNIGQTSDVGAITSFYSFKGGVGRTMVLAQLAWVLASQGCRVLVVDWDLEAPGLREYFYPNIPTEEGPPGGDASGVLGLISRYTGRVSELYKQKFRQAEADLLAELRGELRRGFAEIFAEIVAATPFPPEGYSEPDFRRALTTAAAAVRDQLVDGRGASPKGHGDQELAKALTAQLLTVAGDVFARLGGEAEAVFEQDLTAKVTAKVTEAVRDIRERGVDTPALLRAAVDEIHENQDELDDLTSLEELSVQVETSAGGIAGMIEFMPAGYLNPDYDNEVVSLDWGHFFRNLRGGDFLKAVRARMKHDFQHVLIDNRTGISDTSGIATRILPDTVVTCFSLNDQNIDNSAEIAAQIHEESPGTRVLPLPCRVELSDNPQLRKARLRYESKFEGLIGNHVGKDDRDYWDRAIVPYSPRYAYTETPPREASSDYDEVLKAVEFLAENVTLSEPVKFTVPRDQWKTFTDSFERPPIDADYTRVVLSHSAEDEAVAVWVEWLLKEHGLSVRRQRAYHLDTRILEQELRTAHGNPTNTRSGGTLCVMPLLREDYISLDLAKEAWEWARPRVTKGGREVLLPVRTEQFARLPPFDRPVECVELASALAFGRREEARATLLRSIADRYDVPEEQNEPEPEFPLPPVVLDDREAAERRTARRKATDGDSVTRFQYLLALANQQKEEPAAVGQLKEAVEVARDLGDALKEALAGFLQAAAEIRVARDSAEKAHERAAQLATAAADAVLRLDERDLVVEPVGRLLKLSESDSFKDEAQGVAAAIDRLRGRPLRLDVLARLSLAAAVLDRLVNDLGDAEDKCLAARMLADGLSQRDADLVARCDLEFGLIALQKRERPNAAALTEAEEHFRRACRNAGRTTATGVETYFLATRGLGLVEQLRLFLPAHDGHRHNLAEDYFHEALDVLAEAEQSKMIDPMDADYRRVLIFTHLGALAEQQDKVSDTLKEAKRPDGTRWENLTMPDRYRPAADLLSPLALQVSLPFAWMLRKSYRPDDLPDNAVRPTSQWHRPAVQAFWIYFMLGLMDRREECRRDAQLRSVRTTGTDLDTLRKYGVHDCVWLQKKLNQLDDTAS